MAGFGGFGFQNAAMSPFGGMKAATPAPASPLNNSYKLYDAAVGTQAKDYDNIMGKYNSFYDQLKNSPTPAYNQSQDSKDSLGIQKGLAETGGYSSNDIYSLRERGMSPIRSAYASANRDVDRGRALQGGFSPNYAAVKAKMAREQSAQMSDSMNNVNAGIAQNQAGNRLQGASMYGSNASQENELRNRSTMQGQQLQDNALRGMTSLYGTTPAMSQLFGQQAMQGAGLQNDINQGNNRNNLQLI